MPEMQSGEQAGRGCRNMGGGTARARTPALHMGFLSAVLG